MVLVAMEWDLVFPRALPGLHLRPFAPHLVGGSLSPTELWLEPGAPCFAACGGRCGLEWVGLGCQAWDLTSILPHGQGRRLKSLRELSPLGLSANTQSSRQQLGGWPTCLRKRGLGRVQGSLSYFAAVLSSAFCLRRRCSMASSGTRSPSFPLDRYVLGVCSVSGTLCGPPYSPSPEPSRAPATFWPWQPYSAPSP